MKTAKQRTIDNAMEKFDRHFPKKEKGRIEIAHYLKPDLASAIASVASKKGTTADVLLNEIVADWLGVK